MQRCNMLLDVDVQHFDAYPVAGFRRQLVQACRRTDVANGTYYPAAAFDVFPR